MRQILLLALPLIAAAVPALADPAAVERGFHLAQANCSTCHAVGVEGDSPDTFSPRFRDLSALEPGRSMEEILAKALMLGHPPMPSFGMRGTDRSDVLAYLSSIRQTGTGEPLPPQRRRSGRD